MDVDNNMQKTLKIMEPKWMQIVMATTTHKHKDSIIQKYEI